MQHAHYWQLVAAPKPRRSLRRLLTLARKRRPNKSLSLLPFQMRINATLEKRSLRASKAYVIRQRAIVSIVWRTATAKRRKSPFAAIKRALHAMQPTPVTMANAMSTQANASNAWPTAIVCCASAACAGRGFVRHAMHRTARKCATKSAENVVSA